MSEHQSSCDFCKKGPVLWHLEEMAFRQSSDKGYVRCRATLPVGTCAHCGAKSLAENSDEIFETAEASSRHRPQLIFTGYVADEDLSALYSGALAFVFPSLYEGFGLPPLEAMQCGTPVIASNTTSLPEIVGEAGLMVDPRDEEDLCQAMLRIAREVGLRSELGRRGVDRAAKFSWEKCAEETVKVYHAAAGDRF